MVSYIWLPKPYLMAFVVHLWSKNPAFTASILKHMISKIVRLKIPCKILNWSTMSSLLIQMVNFCGQNMISFVQEKAMMFLFLMILFLCGQELKINTIQKLQNQ